MRGLFRGELRGKGGFYIRVLDPGKSWDFQDLVEWLADHDCVVFYSAEDGWTYVVDPFHNVYYFDDYGYNLYKELKERGETIAPYGGKVQDYVENGYEDFMEFFGY